MKNLFHKSLMAIKENWLSIICAIVSATCFFLMIAAFEKESALTFTFSLLCSWLAITAIWDTKKEERWQKIASASVSVVPLVYCFFFNSLEDVVSCICLVSAVIILLTIRSSMKYAYATIMVGTMLLSIFGNNDIKIVAELPQKEGVVASIEDNKIVFAGDSVAYKSRVCLANLLEGDTLIYKQKQNGKIVSLARKK